MLDPTGRIVMISGATRGIGHETLKRLLVCGYVVSAGVRGAGRLTPGPSLLVHPYDAAVAGDAEAWVAATVQRFGRIDALVNVAGIGRHAPLLSSDEAPLDEIWNVNVKALLRVVRSAWPHLVASGEGRVINLSSLSGKRVRNDNLGYAMSKFAVIALTQEIRRLGWDHGIRASAVCPGFVDTDLTAHVTKMPRHKMSRPEDIAVLIETLLRLPNTASVAELLVNCRHEDML